MEKTVIAICYDFDKTLSTNDMQTFSFIPNLEMKSEDFWTLCNGFAKKNGMDMTLSYLMFMIEECKKRNIKLTKKEA